MTLDALRRDTERIEQAIALLDSLETKMPRGHPEHGLELVPRGRLTDLHRSYRQRLQALERRACPLAPALAP